MANPRLCSIPDCGKTSKHRGWCGMHYSRWLRHGDPLAGRAPRGELPRFYSEEVLTYTGDDCLIWPYSRNCYGYAVMRHQGRQRIVSRMVCAEENGPPPSQDYDAAHSCANGQGGCVARSHLRWTTAKGNSADRCLHGNTVRGDRHKQSKLTEDDVRKIRLLKGTDTQERIGMAFGVSQTVVGMIHRRVAWAWLDG